MRIAQIHGLHTQLPEEELGSTTTTWCRNIWWSLYIIDRHFSSSLGLPMTTQDDGRKPYWAQGSGTHGPRRKIFGGFTYGEPLSFSFSTSSPLFFFPTQRCSPNMPVKVRLSMDFYDAYRQYGACCQIMAAARLREV